MRLSGEVSRDEGPPNFFQLTTHNSQLKTLDC